MKGKAVRVICVGKIKNQWWKQACSHYIELDSRWRKVECIEIKDGDSALNENTRSMVEGEKILACLESRDMPIVLDEKGECMTSEAFADFLHACADTSGKRAVFIIGGPFGLSPDVQARSAKKIALGKMTWPHELARMLLLEQIFRADCILNKFPYHHS